MELDEQREKRLRQLQGMEVVSDEGEENMADEGIPIAELQRQEYEVPRSNGGDPIDVTSDVTFNTQLAEFIVTVFDDPEVAVTVHISTLDGVIIQSLTSTPLDGEDDVEGQLIVAILEQLHG